MSGDYEFAAQQRDVAQAALASTITERDEWRRLAVHALHDLRMLGVEVEKIIGMTPEVIAAVDLYDREMTAYS